MRCVYIFLILSVTIVQSSHARLVSGYTIEELFRKADLVIVGNSDRSRKANDILIIEGYDSSNFQARETTIKIESVLKKPNDLQRDDLGQITLLHFHYSDKVGGVANGALFVDLSRPKGLELEQRATLNKQQIFKGGEIWQPKYLAFLKRLDDGRYVPVMGQYDAELSFFEVRRPAISGTFGLLIDRKDKQPNTAQ